MNVSPVASQRGAPTVATNPFPVYPVSSLREIAPAILERTVSTGPVEAVATAIDEYVRTTGVEHPGLAMRIRGDYGTGKTHLLIYAQALLRSRWSAGRSRVTVLSAPAKEASFAVWFDKTVGPLIAQLDLPGILQQLLADAAIEIADKVRLTLPVAAEIRADPLNVYPALNHGLVNRTEVTRALSSRVDAITPRGSDELRAVLVALAWPECAAAAVRWLSGRSLDTTEQRLLGISRDLDAEEEAESVLMALAGAAGYGDGRFALMVDEFEHLMAHDRSQGTSANATAVKRLLEGLHAMGALVLIAGHWSAWELQPDVKARFNMQATVDLVALTGDEVGKLAAKAAPDWHARLSDAALDAVVEAGRRNIRRVLGILHRLYANTSADTGLIGPAAVDEVSRRIDGSAAPDRKAVESMIEEAVRTAGGQATREESLFGQIRFDLVARRDGEVRLVADVVHATTPVALSQLLEDFSIAVDAVQRRHRAAHGLLCVSGAIDSSAFELLHPLPGIDALAAEGAGAVQAIRELVRGALQPRADDQPTVMSLASENVEVTALKVDAYERIREVRRDREEEAEQTRSRIDEIDFGSTERDVAATRVVRSVVPAAPVSSLGPDRQVLDSFSESMTQQKPSVIAFLFGPGSAAQAAVFVLLGTVLVVLIFGGERLNATVLPYMTPSMLLASIGYVVLAFLASLFALGRRWHRENRAYVQYHRLGRQTLEELILLRFPHNRLLRLKNDLIEAPDITGGFLRALDAARDLAKENLAAAEAQWKLAQYEERP